MKEEIEKAEEGQEPVDIAPEEVVDDGYVETPVEETPVQQESSVPETPASTESSAPVVKEETPVTKPSTPSVKEEETSVTQPSTSNETTVSPDGIITTPGGAQYTSDGGIIIDGKVYHAGDVTPGGMIYGGLDPNE